MERLRINIFTGRLRVEGLRIGGTNDSTVFFALDSFDMRPAPAAAALGTASR